MRKTNLLLIIMGLILAVGLCLAQDAPPDTPGLIDSLLGKYGMWAVMLVVGWIAGRYLKPWIHATPDRLSRANEIGLIADRITDEMILQYPEAKWTAWVNEAVDKLISSCGLTDADDAKALAYREIAHQIVVKQLPGVIKPC